VLPFYKRRDKITAYRYKGLRHQQQTGKLRKNKHEQLTEQSAQTLADAAEQLLRAGLPAMRWGL
jgi:hypothetical protein